MMKSYNSGQLLKIKLPNIYKTTGHPQPVHAVVYKNNAWCVAPVTVGMVVMYLRPSCPADGLPRQYHMVLWDEKKICVHQNFLTKTL